MKFIDALRSVSAKTSQEAEVLALLLEREEQREATGLNELMDKFLKAREGGLQLNEADQTRLLALLLDERLRGLGNYQ